MQINVYQTESISISVWILKFGYKSVFGLKRG
ncbi:hypothetical protein SAMN05443543_11151 [Flavobacterium flevense]|nr:hypothetical protein SAMN05443543_11151 [Flavobacterium flevense]